MDITRRPAPWITEELEMFRASVRGLIRRHFTPELEAWLARGIVDREAWRIAGEAGLLCVSMPTEYGGGGGTFAHDCVIVEELEYAGFGIGFSVALHNAIVAPYIRDFGSEAQKARWLPAMARGEIVGAVAMTEPGAGSDLQAISTRAVRDGDTFRIDGQKTFISNGQLADLVLTVCTTEPGAGAKGLSLIGVEADAPGFARGRKLDKIGLHMSDTSELFYEGAVVPADNLLGGTEGRGFAMLMHELPQERLVIAVGAVAAMERALALTLDYVRQRKAFGKTVADFQNSQFALAECRTEIAAARAFVDDCIRLHLEGALDAATASMAKLWCTERQGIVIDRCLQMFGGNGFMADYPIGRMFVDARVQRIYGGTSEIMKLLIARSL
jgi:acyl-CoA dehydrogenase